MRQLQLLSLTSRDGILKAITSRRTKLTALIALAVACAVSLYLFAANQRHEGDDVGSIKHLVSRHYLLPVDEEPALLTVTDPTKLSTEFLKRSQAGDKVLVYQKSRKAIIYRPSIDRIVDIAPVVIDTPKVPEKE